MGKITYPNVYPIWKKPDKAISSVNNFTWKSKATAIQGLIRRYCTDFGFCSEWDEKAMRGFEWMSDVTLLMCSEDSPMCPDYCVPRYVLGSLGIRMTRPCPPGASRLIYIQLHQENFHSSHSLGCSLEFILNKQEWTKWRIRASFLCTHVQKSYSSSIPRLWDCLT